MILRFLPDFLSVVILMLPPPPYGRFLSSCLMLQKHSMLPSAGIYSQHNLEGRDDQPDLFTVHRNLSSPSFCPCRTASLSFLFYSQKRPFMVLSFPKKFQCPQNSLEKGSLSCTFSFKEDLLHVFQRVALLLQPHNPQNRLFLAFHCSPLRLNISCGAEIKCAASSIPCGVVAMPFPSASSADGVPQSIQSCAREHGSNTTTL
jgi:hypothetical protein